MMDNNGNTYENPTQIYDSDFRENNEEANTDQLRNRKDSNEICNDKIPNTDMVFDTEEEAHQFYNEYARVTGFSVRRSTGHNDVTGRIVYRKFVCACAGKKGPDKRDVMVKRPRAETRTNCGAKMTVNARRMGKFKVTEFVAEHSGHELVREDQIHLLRSHRNINAMQATQIENMDNSGIAPKAGLDLMAEEVGGREKIGFTLADMKNYLYTRRTITMKEGDAGGILSYLQKKQSDDPNFFQAAQLDKNELITNIFWADAQMKAAYARFEDVVSFDTTHKKNKDGRPFALFVGVNHHKQTIIFGAALLYDETAKTFAWVFNTFLQAMNMKKPKTILTDQDAAMSLALRENWVGVKHRLCIWHIYQNAASHLSSVFENFPSFCEDFRSCIYDYEEEDDFFEAWNRMLDKYALHNNDWLMKMFDIKEKWALVYGRKTFCAKMTTTQRSESMHSVLKNYVNNKHNLLKFFRKFEKLIDDRRYEELKADMRTCHSTPSLSLDVSILKHARNVYTHEVFKLFQVELSKAHDASLELISELETVYQYKITPCKKKYNHTVTYDTSNGNVSCSCKKFEFAGILCSHVLKVLNVHHILEIPEIYISKRWTKQANRGLVEDTFVPLRTSPLATPGKKKEDQEKMRIGERYRELCRLFNQLVTRAALTEETFVSVKQTCFKKMEEVDTLLGKGMVNRPFDLKPVAETLVPSETEKRVPNSDELHPQELETSNNVEERTITDFHGTRIRGLKMKEGLKDKSGKRFKSALEQAFSKKRKNKKNNSCQVKLSFDNVVDDNCQNVSVDNIQLDKNGEVQQAISKSQRNKKNNSSTRLSSANQSISVGNCNPNTSNFLQTTPCLPLPQISSYYQNYQVGLPGWNLNQQSLSMPYYTNVLPPMARPNLYNVQNQYGQNACHQFTYNPPQVERDHPNTSMMALLQGQMVQQWEFGNSYTNTSPKSTQLNGINQVRDNSGP